MLAEQIAEMIAKERGHDRGLCNDKCRCLRLAYDISYVAYTVYEDRINKLAEKLDQRTTELQRLQRLVGEET